VLTLNVFSLNGKHRQSIDAALAAPFSTLKSRTVFGGNSLSLSIDFIIKLLKSRHREMVPENARLRMIVHFTKAFGCG